MKTKVATSTSSGVGTDSLTLELVRLDGVAGMVCGDLQRMERWMDGFMATGQPKSSWSHSIIQLRILYCTHTFIVSSP
jgi:hypothetical protein